MPASSQQSPTSGRRSAGLPHSRSRCARRRSTAGAAPPGRRCPLVARSRSSCLGRDHGHVAVRAEVEGQRQAPVALAADAPVAHVAQPVLHPLAVLRRRPLDAAGGLDHRLADLVAADEPLVHQPEDQLGAAAPADGVAVGDLPRLDQPPALPEVLDDLLRRVAGVAAVQPAVAVVEGARLVHRHERGQALAHAQLEVLGAAAGRDVDDAGALVHRRRRPSRPRGARPRPARPARRTAPRSASPTSSEPLTVPTWRPCSGTCLEAALGHVGDARRRSRRGRSRRRAGPRPRRWPAASRGWSSTPPGTRRRGRPAEAHVQRRVADRRGRSRSARAGRARCRSAGTTASSGGPCTASRGRGTPCRKPQM